MGTYAEFEVQTDQRVTTVDVTDRVAAQLSADERGTCTVFVRHTTAGMSVNEAEPRLLGDIEHALESIVPATGWDHDELDGSPASEASGTSAEERPAGSESAGNADAHLRSMLLGRDVTVPVADGRPDLGTWQSILLVECDGPRTRTVTVVSE
ncbi:YjbQ family protein [Halorientalis halophila]|uniref:YjbQ family protein n=1 Tax=Halorientalis halophila TaxID=3108499 RepID=UPI00300A1C2D